MRTAETRETPSGLDVFVTGGTGVLGRQVAIQQGTAAAANVLRSILGQPRAAFRYAARRAPDHRRRRRPGYDRRPSGARARARRRLGRVSPGHSGSTGGDRWATPVGMVL
jgi:hypothetical protein